jgi:hypothetical protein
MSTKQKVRRLRAEGYSYRTIADKIGLSVGAVQRQLQKPSTVFKLRERDPDFFRVEKALEMGATLREAWNDYAETAAKPYSFSHFGVRVTEWEKVGKPSSGSPLLPPKLHDQRSREPSFGSGTEGQRSNLGKDPRPPQSLLAPSQSFAAMSPPSILWIDIPGTALQVRMKSVAVRFGDGRERHFPRGKHSLRTIILHASGASVAIEAARWAVDEGITVLIMHRAGEALAFLTNHPLADCSGPALELRRAQFSADPVKVARAVVRAKIDASRTEGVLSDEDAGFGARKLLKAETVDEIMLIEAAIAGIYWRHWYGFELSFSGKAPPEWKR